MSQNLSKPSAEDVRRYAASNRFELSLERAATLAEPLAAILSADAELDRIDLSGYSPVGPIWPDPLSQSEATDGG